MQNRRLESLHPQSPGDPTHCFCSNDVKLVHVHGQSHLGMQLGQDPTNSDSIYSNRIDFGMNTDGLDVSATPPPVLGMQVWGDRNIITASIESHGALFRGLSFEAGATCNDLRTGRITAVTPVFYADSPPGPQCTY